jgi:anti-sigma regulatory factor (Ser/Thr protein kinase)
MTVWTGRFSGGSLAARAARRAVREALGGELPERQLEDVQLLVSELATNSVRHAGCDEHTEISMMARVDDKRIRLRVCDGGDGFEEARAPEPHAARAGGYGLVLVDRLADRWGVQHNGGFCVWFEVERAQRA